MALKGIEYALAVVIAIYILFSKYILFVSGFSALLVTIVLIVCLMCGTIARYDGFKRWHCAMGLSYR
jgi:uncharacterized membrane protein